MVLSAFKMIFGYYSLT